MTLSSKSRNTRRMLRTGLLFCFIGILALQYVESSWVLGAFDCTDLDATQCKNKFGELFTYYSKYKSFEYLQGLDYFIKETLNIESAKHKATDPIIKLIEEEFVELEKWQKVCSFDDNEELQKYDVQLRKTKTNPNFEKLFEAAEFTDKDRFLRHRLQGHVFLIWKFLYSRLRASDIEAIPEFKKWNDEFIKGESLKEKDLPPLEDIFAFFQVSYPFKDNAV